MRRDTRVNASSSIYERIEHARMADSDREVALNALRQADLFIDAFMWIAKKVERLGARLFLKPRSLSDLDRTNS